LSGTARANPYQTPSSALHELEGMLERRLVLKLYLVLASLGVAVRTLLVLMREPALPLDFVHVATLAISLLALLGYAYRRRIVGAQLWKLWLPVPIAVAVLAGFGLVHDELGNFPLVTRAYAYLFDAPLWAAVYLYAFRSADIWR
jgi:hypothetical protein